jgi:PST family polysaccharide transporter
MIDSAQGPGLSGRVAKSAAWIVAARFVMRLFGFVNTIVLARLLAPQDFGLVAVATAAMQLLQGFTEIGVSQAVIRFRDADRTTLNALFTLSALRGATIASILLIAAPFAADFYGDPRMAYVFVGVAVYPLLAGLINPAFYEFERNLDLSREFVSSAVNKLAGVLVSIGIAIAFRTYWAIILGLAVNGLVQLALSYAMRPYRPGLSLKGARKVIGFSGWLFGVSVATALNNKLDMFVVARFTGPVGAGIYSIGTQFAELPTSEIAEPAARAMYPGLSALQGDRARATAAYLKGVEALAAVAMPAAFGFAFLAEDVVALLLGAQWEAAVPLIQYFAPMLGVATMLMATYYFALAIGEARLIFFREMIFFILRFPIFLWAAIAHGLTGIVYAATATSLIRFALNLAIFQRVSGDPFWTPVWRARRSFAAIAAMAAWFLLLRPQISALDGLPILARMAADAATGAAIYCGAHLLLWRAAGLPAGAESALLEIARRTLDGLRPART